MTEIAVDKINGIVFFSCGDAVLKSPVAYRSLLLTSADGLILSSCDEPGEGFFLGRGYWRPPVIKCELLRVV